MGLACRKWVKPQHGGQKRGVGERKQMRGEQTLRDTPIFPLAHRGLVRYRRGGMRRIMGPQLVETDSRSRVVLPGHANERFLARENADGSILLEPAHIVSDAQHEYDNSPELQELLARAAVSPHSITRRSRV